METARRYSSCPITEGSKLVTRSVKNVVTRSGRDAAIVTLTTWQDMNDLHSGVRLTWQEWFTLLQDHERNWKELHSQTDTTIARTILMQERNYFIQSSWRRSEILFLSCSFPQVVVTSYRRAMLHPKDTPTLSSPSTFTQISPHLHSGMLGRKFFCLWSPTGIYLVGDTTIVKHCWCYFLSGPYKGI